MSRTALPVPLTDASYWRRLLATCHPDKDGGDPELFLFLTGLREHVEGCSVLCSNHTGTTTQDRNSYYQDRAYGNGSGGRGDSAREEQDTAARIPFADYPVEHIDLLRRALRIGQESAGGGPKKCSCCCATISRLPAGGGS